MTELVTIASDRITARINPLGAELWSLTDPAGREYMTGADPAYWSGHAPLLFPIVGALRHGCYRIGQRIFQLPRHGFARHSHFKVIAAEPGLALFQLSQSAETLAVYPYRFVLEVEFRAEGDTLRQVVTVTNPAAESLWFSLGIGLLVLQAGALLAPGLSLGMALAAITVGSLLGVGVLAAAGVVGADTGLSSMGSIGLALGKRGAAAPAICWPTTGS